MEVPSTRGRSLRELHAALAAGELSESAADLSAARVLALTEWGSDAKTDADVDAHHTRAREVAAASIVLLKNDGALPLAHESQVAAIGEFARTPRFLGGPSSHVNAVRTRLWQRRAGKDRFGRRCPGGREHARGQRRNDTSQKPAQFAGEVDRLAIEKPLQLKPVGHRDEEGCEAARRHRISESTLVDESLEIARSGFTLAAVPLHEVVVRGMVRRCRLR